jgi:lysozyme family protein
VNFDQAFERTLGHEGGYCNNPADPGGETKFGISKRAYPALDIAALTVDQAKAIYLRDYWGPAGCDAVPECIKADLFDMAVNAGVRKAIMGLQAAVGTAEDGVLGPHTLQAANSMQAGSLVARFNGARLAHLATLSSWPAFGRGWANRIAQNLMEA